MSISSYLPVPLTCEFSQILPTLITRGLAGCSLARMIQIFTLTHAVVATDDISELHCTYEKSSVFFFQYSSFTSLCSVCSSPFPKQIELIPPERRPQCSSKYRHQLQPQEPSISPQFLLSYVAKTSRCNQMGSYVVHLITTSECQSCLIRSGINWWEKENHCFILRSAQWTVGSLCST